MPRGMGGFRRAIAALVALALLVLPVAPMRHASAAAPAHHPATNQVAAHHCAADEREAAQGHALGSHHADHGQHHRHPGDRPDLACCAAAQCPATVVAPPVTPAQSVPLHGPPVAGFTVPATPDGIAVDPALRPPRRPA